MSDNNPSTEQLLTLVTYAELPVIYVEDHRVLDIRPTHTLMTSLKGILVECPRTTEVLASLVIRFQSVWLLQCLQASMG